MSSEQLKTIARRYLEEGSRNPAVYDEIVAPDIVAYVPGQPEPSRGIPALKQGLTAWRSAFPDFAITVHDVVAEGDKAVLRWSVRGRNTGSFQGMPPTGKEGSSTGITILRFRDGKVVEDHSQIDVLGILQQIGAIPAGSSSGSSGSPSSARP